MPKHFPIKTLIGLAQDDLDAAAKQLDACSASGPTSKRSLPL